ncbi:MAG: hypothetical protein KF881_12135, partial [Acidobacteria bacterium]|nr:hypothetical protein [Acidobacteriota bacterium]
MIFLKDIDDIRSAIGRELSSVLTGGRVQRSSGSAFGGCAENAVIDGAGNVDPARAFSAFTRGTQAASIPICSEPDGRPASEMLTSETLVEFAGGSLTITDGNGGNTNDTITVSCAAGNLIVNDPSNTVGGGTGTTQIDPNTVSVPLASITGSITVNTLAGNDTLTVDLSGCNVIPAGGIFYNGGLPATAPGDRLNIVGGDQGTVTYNYINASDGSVVMSNFGAINYTGLEPISNTGTAADAIFNLPAGPTDPATLSDLGGGMSRLAGATFEDTDFMNPTGSVSINRGNAADVLVVNALATGYPTLNIGTDLLPLRGLVFTGPITFAANSNLSVFATNGIIFNTPTADIVASGTGTISLTSARNITLSAGSSLQVENGDLTMNANQQAVPTPGYFYGVDVFSALVQTVGSGNILINGKGGSDTLSAPTVISTVGVAVRGVDSAVRSNSPLPGAGGITINGISGNAGATFTFGVLISQGLVTSVNGNIGIDGVGGTTTGNTLAEQTASNGVNIGATVSTTGTGALSISGTTGQVGPNPASTRGMQLSGSISTLSGNLSLNGQSGNAAGASSYGITSTAAIASTSGQIDMTGVGGSAAGNAGFVTSAGINFSAGGSMSCGNGAGCTFSGTADNGGIGASQGYRQDSPMTSTGSNVSITGTGGTAETANFGVSIRNNITASGNANISIIGTGGNGSSGSNHAVQIRGGAVVSTTNGTITAEAIPGTGPDNVAFNLAPTGTGNGTLTAGGGNDVMIIADSMFFGPTTAAVNAANSVVTLRQRTNGVAIDLGAVTDPATGPLGLNDAEIDRIAAAHLRIGNANSGPISFSGLVPIVVTDTPFIPVLSLTTGGAINSNPSPGVPDVVAEVLNLSALTSIAVEMNAETVNTVSGGPQNLRELDSVLVGSNAINAGGNILTLSGGRFNTTTGGGNIIASDVIAQSGAAIGGVGSVVTSGSGIDAQTGSAISPGLSPGILTTNSVAFATGSIFDVEVNGTTVGIGYDRLNVAGTVDVTNATLSVSGAHVPTAGETFLIIANDGTDAVVGTFNGLPEGGTIVGFLGSGLDAAITYIGGDGNDVVITVQAAPTPTPTPTPTTEVQFAAA